MKLPYSPLCCNIRILVLHSVVHPIVKYQQIQTIRVVTIGVNLHQHILNNDVCCVLFDCSIWEFDIMYQDVQILILNKRTNCVAISLNSTMEHLSHLYCLILKKEDLCIDEKICHKLLVDSVDNRLDGISIGDNVFKCILIIRVCIKVTWFH